LARYNPTSMDPSSSQPLSYASTITPDGVRIDRQLDHLLVKFSPPRRRVGWLIVLVAIFALAAAAFLYLWISATNSAELIPLLMGLVSTLICAGIAIAMGKQLKHLLSRVAIEADRQRIIVSRRFADRIGRDEWPRQYIAGLRIAPTGWDELFRRQFRLELWFTNGQAIVLHTGSNSLIVLLAQTLGDALGYSLQSAWCVPLQRVSRRLTLRTIPIGIEFQLRLSRFSWQQSLLLLPAIALALFANSHYLSDRRDRIESLSNNHWSLELTRVVFFSALFFIFAGELLQRLCRRKFIAVFGQHLTLVELSLTSPIRQQWPIDQIYSVEVKDRRLFMNLIAGNEVELLTDEDPADLQWIARGLSAVLPKHFNLPPIVGLEYIPPPDTASLISLIPTTRPADSGTSAPTAKP
jgi:hypothetical protein